MSAHDSLLEREPDIEVLLAAVGEVSATGRGSTVLVTGEAGIGKTSVIRAFLERLEVRVLVGACDDLRTPRAFGPLADAVAGSNGPLARALASGDAGAVFDAAIRELDGPRPAVLVVEDVHWADDATLDVLGYLGRRLPDLPAVLVLSFRDEALDTVLPLRRLLAGLAGTEVRRLPLQPLTAAAVATLAVGTATDPDELYRHTHGNPFYVAELLREAGDGSQVPASVTDAVLARVARLPAQTVRALEQLSVVPTRLAFGVAEQLVELDALAAAEQELVVQVDGDGVGFRHELARRAVEQSLPAITRRRLNAAVLRALLAGDAPDVARVVHHAVEADDVPTVLEHAPRAARDAAERGAHTQALAHFETVLPYADRLDIQDRAALMSDYGWELQYAQRYTDSVRAGREAVALTERTGDRSRLAETLLRLARELYLAGDTQAALDMVDRAAEIGPSAAIATYRGIMLVRMIRSAEAVTTLEQARELAVADGRQDLVALAENFLGMARSDLGDPRGPRQLWSSLDRSIAAGDHASTAHLYTHLAEICYRFGDWAELDTVLERGLAFARDRGYWGNAYNLEVHQALLRMRRGEWDAAENQLRRLVESLDDPGMLYVYSIPTYGRLLARRGDPRAGPLLEAAWERARQQVLLLGFAYAGIAYIEWAWLTGQPGLAEPIKTRLLRNPPAGVPALRAELERYLARAGLGGEPFDGCPDGYAAGLRGDWRTAAAQWQRIGDPYEEALELAESGEVAPTVEALRILDGLDAKPAAALVRGRLKDLGVRVPRGARRSTRSNPAGLTDRQVDVLRLLADGLTNAEIADRLVLSVRTVDHHVSGILTKLDVGSRREAAAAWLRIEAAS